MEAQQPQQPQSQRRRPTRVSAPVPMSLWSVSFSIGYNPGFMCAQGVNANHARQNMLRAWRTNKFADHTFPYATDAEEFKKMEGHPKESWEAFSMACRARDEQGQWSATRQWKVFGTMEEALQNAFFTRVEGNVVFSCALDG